MLGVARAQMTDEDFASGLLEDVKEYCGDCVEDSKLWDSFSRRFYYFARRFQDDKLLSQGQRSTGEDRPRSLDSWEFFLLPGDGSKLFRSDRREAGGQWVDGPKRRPLAPGDYRKALRPRSGISEGSKSANPAKLLTKNRFTVSIIIWEKKPFKILWRSVSPTESSSRSGTAAISIMCRFPWRKLWAWKAAAATTIRPARCAIWCQTTSCS